MPQQERNIIANTYDAAPLGLEIIGQNSELSQTQEVINNAPNIVLFGGVKRAIEKFADYTGSLGRKIMPRNLVLLGGIGTMAVAAACGGGSKDNADQVSAKPDAPAAPAVVRTLEPTPVPVVKAEAQKPNTEVQLPSATEVPKSAIPAEAQLILTSLDKLTFRSPEEIEQLKKNFEVEYPKSLTATSLLKKAEPYLNLYDNLSSIYNQTTNLGYRNTVRTQLLSIEGVIKVNWPELYKSLVANGGFVSEAGVK